MAMYRSDRPTGSPCLHCKRDKRCPHPCQSFREWFHDRWPGPKAETFGIVAPDEDFKTCRWCGAAFRPDVPQKQYCCEACLMEAKRQNNREYARRQRQ